MSQVERIYEVSRYQIVETARNTESSVEAAEILGIPYKTFAKLAKHMGIFKESKHVAKIKLSEILEGLHPNYSTTRLKERLIEENVLPYLCAECSTVEWRGKKLVLQLDHIDGNNSNHRLDNLRLLCPNCHSQTATYAGNNNK